MLWRKRMRWKGGRAVFIFTGQRKERVSSKPRRFKVSVCSREKHSMDFSNQTAFKKKIMCLREDQCRVGEKF